MEGEKKGVKLDKDLFDLIRERPISIDLLIQKRWLNAETLSDLFLGANEPR